MRLEGITAYIASRKQEIRGKKAFQKLLYFLTAVKVPTGLNFEMFHYGPYSSQLDYAMENLENQGAIISRFDNAMFHIYPGTSAETWAAESHEFIQRYQNQFDLVLEKLPDSARELELWATTHFLGEILRDVYGITYDGRIIEEVIKVKGSKFSSTQIQQAITELRGLKLL